MPVTGCGCDEAANDDEDEDKDCYWAAPVITPAGSLPVTGAGQPVLYDEAAFCL